MSEPAVKPVRFQVGQTVERRFTIYREDMTAFERLSGDRNPIHSVEAFAQEHGFEQPVVYGGLLLSKISELLGMWLPGPGCVWVGINLSFLKALFVGQACLLKGEVLTVPTSVGLMKINLTITRDAETITRGTSEVYVPER